MNATLKIAFDASTKRHKDANGYLHIDSSHITKEQVVGYYGAEIGGDLLPDRIYYAYRPADEIKKAAETFNGIPILFEHHEESAYTPCKDYRVGSTGTDAVFKAPYLDNSLHITDGAAIAAIESGDFQELSCAYTLVADWTEGEFEGQHYDFIQRNIKGNHVALVTEGRAGHDVRVADASINQSAAEPQKEESIMGKVEELLAKLVALMGGDKEGCVDGENAEPSAEEKVVVEKEDKEEKKAEAEPKDPVERANDNEELNALLEAIGNEEIANALRKYIAGLTQNEDAEAEKSEETPAEAEAEVKAEAEEKAAAGAADSAARILKQLASVAEARISANMKAKYKAAQDCAPLVGSIVDPFAYDSADAIYKLALDAKGVDTSKHPVSAYKSMVSMLKEADMPRVATARSASDSKSTEFDGAFEHLKNIRRA